MAVTLAPALPCALSPLSLTPALPCALSPLSLAPALPFALSPLSLAPPIPARARPRVVAPASRDVSGLMARRASSFTAASRLLPDGVRDDVTCLYAVFRDLDDLVDTGAVAAASRVDAVAEWAAGARAPVTTPEVVALDRLSARHPLPRDAIADFCAGMRHDLAGSGLRTEADVDTYCYRVAGTVGVVMAAILGSDDWPEARASAVALGIAMQRTNILRDIDEDLAGGRVYISDEARARHGRSLRPGEREALVRDQIARADALYEDGLLGLPLLRRGRPAIALAAGLYREILREIERDGYGRHAGRAVVSDRRRLRTVLRVTFTGR